MRSPNDARLVADIPENTDKNGSDQRPTEPREIPSYSVSGVSSGESADYDPDGIEVALWVASGIQNMLPPIRRRKRQNRENLSRDVKFSGSHPDARDPQLVGDALSTLIRRNGWEEQIGVRSLLARWPSLVGEANAKHSKPESYQDGELVVSCESTVWAQSLRMIASALVARLNERLGDGTVKRVVVKGPTAPSWKHGPRSVPGRGPRDTYG